MKMVVSGTLCEGRNAQLREADQSFFAVLLFSVNCLHKAASSRLLSSIEFKREDTTASCAQYTQKNPVSWPLRELLIKHRLQHAARNDQNSSDREICPPRRQGEAITAAHTHQGAAEQVCGAVGCVWRVV